MSPSVTKAPPRFFLAVLLLLWRPRGLARDCWVRRRRPMPSPLPRSSTTPFHFWGSLVVRSLPRSSTLRGGPNYLSPFLCFYFSLLKSFFFFCFFTLSLFPAHSLRGLIPRNQRNNQERTPRWERREPPNWNVLLSFIISYERDDILPSFTKQPNISIS